MKALLLSILYYFSITCFGLSLIILIYSIGFDLFSDSSQIGNFVSGNHHSIGYSYPVDIQNSIPDSVITYQSEEYHQVLQYYRNSNNLSTVSTNQDTLKDKIVNKILVYPKLDKNITLITEKLENSFPMSYNSTSLSSKGYVILNTNSLWMKTLLALRFYIGIILLIPIFYLLMVIFRKLRINLNFNKGLSNKTKAIGLLFLSSEIIKILLVLILSKYANAIRVESFLNQKYLYGGVQINITPRLDFDVALFTLGLTLVIIGYLFDKADNLKQENDLTI